MLFPLLQGPEVVFDSVINPTLLTHEHDVDRLVDSINRVCCGSMQKRRVAFYLSSFCLLGILCRPRRSRSVFFSSSSSSVFFSSSSPSPYLLLLFCPLVPDLGIQHVVLAVKAFFMRIRTQIFNVMFGGPSESTAPANEAPVTQEHSAPVCLLWWQRPKRSFFL